MSTDFPTTAEITADVLRALKATGVDTDAIAGDTEVRTPITGEVIFSVRSHTERRRRRGDRRGRRGVHRLAGGAGTGARPAGQALGRAADRAQGGSGHAGHRRGRQDHLRGARRGAGDDRHHRPRRRSVAPAVRQDHALGAAGPPADGDLAPAGRGRDHLRLQLPGRGLRLEHRPRPGGRRHGGLEAGRGDAAVGPGHRRPARPGRGGRRGAGRSPPPRARRPRRRPGAWWRTRASRWCRRPDRCGWAGRSLR